MFILVKRYPNETDISRIVSKLRQHHSVLKIAASRSQSGGHHPETLYSMASRTNGLCVFSEDFGMEAVVDHMQAIFYPYLIYVADPDVSGTGTIQLTSMNTQQAGIYNFYMTVQDDGPMDVVQTALLNMPGKEFGIINNQTILDELYGSCIFQVNNVGNNLYSMRLDYNYLDNKSRRLQIRVVAQVSNINYWQPYYD